MNDPLLFIHGSGDSARIWRLQSGQFAPHASYAIDLPGHGQRPDSLEEEVAVLDYAQSVRDIATRELELERPIIAGHSLGGAIALTMALHYGAELGGIILIGTGARLRVKSDLLEAARAQPQEARTALTALAMDPVNAAALSATISEQEPNRANILYRDLAACNVFDCMQHLNEIQLPTLIICGEHDRMTPVKYSQYLHAQIAGSTLRIIADAGHYVMREQPEAVNEAIQVWLAEASHMAS